MCGLVGSYDIHKLQELYLDNVRSGRGTVAYSLFRVSEGSFASIEERAAFFDAKRLYPEETPEGEYFILHSLAPTTGAVNLHPAKHYSAEETDLLWHNGIIKANEVRRLQTRQVRDTGINVYSVTWDTELLLLELIRTGTLDDIDGSFACFYYNTEIGLTFFRNELANLYYDEFMNISTEPFEGGALVQPNTFFNLDCGVVKELGSDGKFKPHFTPYFI